MTAMTSNKPYLIRAFYDWIVDNDCTSYLVVVDEYPGLVVPNDISVDSRITLNLKPSAVHDLILGDQLISFSARFSGVSVDLTIPVGSVVAVFAKENGHGTGFEPDPYEEQESKSETKKAPGLKVVK